MRTIYGGRHHHARKTYKLIKIDGVTHITRISGHQLLHVRVYLNSLKACFFSPASPRINITFQGFPNHPVPQKYENMGHCGR